VREVRQRGFMVGIELVDVPLEARMGHQVTLEARRRGAIVRPLGDVIVLMPPLGIETADLRRLVDITAQSIETATGIAEEPLAQAASGLALVGDEVLLAGAADGADPVARDVLESGAGGHAAVGVALFRVVDESAGLADPLLLNSRLAHRAERLGDAATRPAQPVP
jgi:hypothetical protein